MASLSTLPAEILIDEILSRLSWPSVAACLQVCKTLHQRLSEDTSLSYRKQLYLAGMIDNPRSSVPLEAKLEKLKEREGRWRQFVPRSVSVAQTPEDISGHYEVESGIYSLARTNLDDSVSSIAGWRLPADDDLIHEEPFWEPLEAGQEFIDYGMSVDANDLVILGCKSLTTDQEAKQKITIHLIQWSTKLPHPSAALPILDTGITLGVDVRVASAHLRVTGDTLVAIFSYSNPPPREDNFSNWLFIWNWKTGQMAKDRHWLVPGSSFVFLREDLIGIPDDALFSFRVYEIPPACMWSSPCLKLVSEFRFPQTKNAGPPGETTIQCTHSPADLTSRLLHLPPLRAFSTDPAESIILFELDVSVSWQETGLFLCLVRHGWMLDMTLKHLETMRSDPGFNTGARCFAWERWGPDNTRLFDIGNDVGLPFMTAVHGSRVVRLNSSENSQTPGALLLLDFGRHKARKAELRARDLGKASGVRVHQDEVTKLVSAVTFVGRDQPTVIKGDCFEHDVVTRLPFIQTTVIPWDSEEHSGPRKREKVARWMNKKLRVPIPKSLAPTHFEWEGVMLSEQCFIGTIGSGDDQYTPSSVEVFHFG